MIYGFIAGAVETDAALRDNRRAFDEYGFVPRVLNDVSSRNQMTTLFGMTYAAPFGIPPFGSAGLCADLGDRDSHCGSSAAQAGRAHRSGRSGGVTSRVLRGRRVSGSCIVHATLAARHESGSGTSETSRRDQAESAYEVKAVVQWTS